MKSTFFRWFALAAVFVHALPAGAQAPADNPDPVDKVYAMGAIPPSREQILGFKRSPQYRAFLPASVDISANFPPPGDQGEQGSCVAWSVGYAARSYYVSSRQGLPVTQAENVPSPAYIYNLGLAKQGTSNCDSGMIISNALDILKDGVVSIAEFPYNDSLCTPAPSAAMQGRAKEFQIDDWQFIDSENIDTIKGELAHGNPVMFGTALAKNFMRHRGSGVYQRRPSDQLLDGGHAMVLVGYDESRQAFRLQNSWGRDWGDRGQAWFAYDTFRRDAHGAYVMRLNTPPPKPAPPAPVVVVPPPEPAPPIPVVIVPPPGPAPPPPAPTPVVGPFTAECSKIVIRNEGGRMVARGFVGKADDLARLRQSVTGQNTDIAVEVRPWPQCETLLTLDRALAAPDRPSVAVLGGATSLIRGQTMGLEVIAPGAPSQLHVAYFQADGSVAHLVQSDATNLRTFDRRARVNFGDGREGRPTFKVAAPFGPEMVIVIASRAPIFPEPRPKVETEREFLTALRRALSWKPDPSAPDREVTAAYVAIETKEN